MTAQVLPFRPAVRRSPNLRRVGRDMWPFLYAALIAILFLVIAMIFQKRRG
jgi:hypothetical protein